MKFRLVINVDNASFADDRLAEISATLREVANRIDDGDTPIIAKPIRDASGNLIGSYQYTGKLRQ